MFHRRKGKKIQKWKQPYTRWINDDVEGALVEKFTVFECFPLHFPFSSTFAKVQFALDAQINFRNRVKAACFSTHQISSWKGGKTAEYLSDVRDFHSCVEQSILSDDVLPWIFLLLLYFIFLFTAPPKIKRKSSGKLKF